MKATEQYFPIVLFTALYKVALTFESLGKILSVILQMKATEQYFLVVLFFYALQGESSESYRAEFSAGAVFLRFIKWFLLLRLSIKS